MHLRRTLSPLLSLAAPSKTYHVTGKLLSKVLDVVHDVVDAHFIRVLGPGKDRVVEGVDHGATGCQGVSRVHCHVTVGLGWVEALRKPKGYKAVQKFIFLQLVALSTFSKSELQ